MPLKENEVQNLSTKQIIFMCLEKKDEEGNYMYWSIRELSSVANKVPSTIHHHINPLQAYDVLEVMYSADNPQTPVYKIKDPEKYFEIKDKIMKGKIKTSKRIKLRRDEDEDEMVQEKEE